MRDLQLYWQEIRALEASLPQFVWVIADGVLSEVSAYIAAKLLHGKSHRVATEKEISEHAARGAAANRDATRESLSRRGVAVVPVAPRTIDKQAR
jgi:hypothetical protein